MFIVVGETIQRKISNSYKTGDDESSVGYRCEPVTGNGVCYQIKT